MEPTTTNKELLEMMRESRVATHAEFVELDRKFDGIQTQLDAFRKEQRAESDAQRREMLSYFVAKTEFNPHREYVMAKFAEYDRIVNDSRQQTPEWIRSQEDIKLLKKTVEANEASTNTRFDEVKKRGSTTWTNIVTIIMVVVAILSLLINGLPHITIHP